LAHGGVLPRQRISHPSLQPGSQGRSAFPYVCTPFIPNNAIAGCRVQGLTVNHGLCECHRNREAACAALPDCASHNCKRIFCGAAATRKWGETKSEVPVLQNRGSILQRVASGLQSPIVGSAVAGGFFATGDG